jgi:hypothetical protein
MIVTHQDAGPQWRRVDAPADGPVDWLASSLPADHPIPPARAGRRNGACAAKQDTMDGIDVRFEMLQPTVELYAMARLKPNDLSCVVRVVSDYGSVLHGRSGSARAGARPPRSGVAQGRRARRSASWQRDVVDTAFHRPLRRGSPCTRPAIAIDSAILRADVVALRRWSARIAPTSTAR